MEFLLFRSIITITEEMAELIVVGLLPLIMIIVICSIGYRWVANAPRPD